MNVREAVREDLPAVIGLLHADVIREIDESGLGWEAYAEAFEASRVGMEYYLGSSS